jgi:RNA polymerase sigma-70 factor (ECF subfamily)
MVDRYLVRQCQRGDKDALRRIYEKYRDYLLIVAIALSHDADLAEDAVQDAFVGFAQNVASFRLTGSLKAYLGTCAAHRVRDLLRARRRSRELSCDGSFVESAEPSQSIGINEELTRLSGALAQLPAEQRETIVLHLHAQMRFRAIAEMQNTSVNTVKGRYRYGIQRLRTLLESEDVT